MAQDAARRAACAIWAAHGLPLHVLEHLHLSVDPDPSVNSSFKLGTAAQTSIGLSALAAAHFHELRTGQEQDVTVDARHAVIEFNSEKYYLIDGQLPKFELFDELAGMYKTADGHVRLHTNFPHHKQGILDMLGCASDRSAVAESLAKWNAIEFEQQAIRRGLCAVALRPFGAHTGITSPVHFPYPVTIVKVGDAPKRQIRHGERFQHSLDGVRVVDMTRVLAGPVCGRTLATHGADVLLITSPNLPSLPALDVDTSRGKRTAQLDLDNLGDAATLRRLVADADVFLQAYRPGGLAARGFAPEDVAIMRPGIVYASLSAYPPDSSYRDVKGFDSLVQTLSGFNVAETDAYAQYARRQNMDVSDLPPYRTLPMQALDHAAGYFLAFGIAAALSKTITDGGSWRVHVSLAATASWVRDLGMQDPSVAFGAGARPLPDRSMPPDPEIVALSTTVARLKDGSGNEGEMTGIRHAARMSGTGVVEGTAPMRLDAHSPHWLPRADTTL